MKTIDKILPEFATATREHYDTYSFAVGYLEAILCRHFANFPEDVQTLILKQLNKATEEYKAKDPLFINQGG